MMLYLQNEPLDPKFPVTSQFETIPLLLILVFGVILEKNKYNFPKYLVVLLAF